MPFARHYCPLYKEIAEIFDSAGKQEELTILSEYIAFESSQ